MNTQLLDQAQQLTNDEQIELVQALWDNIVQRKAVPAPSDAQKRELDQRLADHEAKPDDVVSWAEVKAAAHTRIRQ